MKIIGSEKSLNIISLDIPYPPDYGGAVDIWHKLIALKKMGIKINLHCFYYNRFLSKEMEKLSFKTYYYQRDMNYLNLLSRRPFIIKSRSSSELIKNLLHNDAPILFEGLHTCHEIENPQLSQRIKIIRMHNIEYQYYNGLSKLTNIVLKKIYYRSESRKLYNFEKLINYADLICAISDNDYRHYENIHSNVMKLPVFHGHNMYHSESRGEYALFHGNFNVIENEFSALYLINNIFKELDYPLIIAGKNPGRKIKRLVKLNYNVYLKDNIKGEKLNDLIANASIHILPAFQSSGLKLKLIHVLGSSGHIITNSKMITDNNLSEFCNIAESPEEMKKMIIEKAEKSLKENEIIKRQKMLEKYYLNERNAEILINRIFH